MTSDIISSPHIHSNQSTNRIMLLVILAMLPGMAAQWYFFGIGFIIQIFLAIISAWIAESVILYIRRMSITHALLDNSALLTAFLLAVSLPPLSPWWLVIIGTIFAIIIAKQLYGGLGHNPFNPAMIGYVVLLISFPVQMTGWLPPNILQEIKTSAMDSISMIFTGHTVTGYNIQQLQLNVDGISQATPLDAFKIGLSERYNSSYLSQSIYNGLLAGLGWEWINIGYLLGGIFLLIKKVIRWHIPISFLASLILCAIFGWILAPEKFNTPLIHCFSGATMLGAFFIATDPVTASTTNLGRLIYGTFIGLLVWFIRSFGGYPDGVAFAVLLANICVPLLDYYTQPCVYGHH